MQRDISIVAGVVFAALAGAGIFYWQGGAADDRQAIREAAFTELARGQQSKVSERANYLITSEEQLSELWKMIDASSPLPEIDFDTHSVIAVFTGQEPTAGYAIEISKITDAAERTVAVMLTIPGDGCMLAQVLTSPYQIVSVPITALPLTHKDASTLVDCRD